MSSNILCLNDWEIRRFLLAVAAIQLAVLALLGIDPAPPLLAVDRVVLGSIYIAVIPGAILLRVLRLHDLGTSRTLVYTVCLSLAFALLLGFVVNASYPSLGIARPLSTWPIGVTYAVVLSLLLVFVYFQDRSYRPRRQGVLPPASWFLFFLSLPLVAVLGAELVNSRDDSTVLMVLLPVLALIPVLAVWFKFVPEEVYPWAIFTVAVSVLLHVSLISPLLVGRDIQIEYRIFELVEERSLWDSTSPAHDYNATLSVTILPVLISRLTGLEGIDIFKVFYPVLLGLVPLAMYEVLQQYMDRRWALVAVFFVVFQYAFFFTMPQTAKQEMGWVFLAALLLTLVGEHRIWASSLRVVFLLAVVASHYASAYLALVLLVTAVAVLAWRQHTSWRIGVNLVLLALTATIGWYMYTSNSVVFDTFVRLGEDFVDSLSSGFTEPGAGYAMTLASRSEQSLSRLALKYEYIALQAFIAIGLMSYLWRWIRGKRVEFSADFMAFSVASFVLFGSSVAIPYFATFGDISRVFSLPLFILAPFAITGVATIFSAAAKVSRLKGGLPFKQTSRPSQTRSTGGPDPGFLSQPTGARSIALAFTALFAAVFFLFSSGFVSEITKEEYPLSFAVSGNRMHAPVINDEDMSSANWLLDEHGLVEYYYDFFVETIFLSIAPPGELYQGLLTVTGEQTVVAQKDLPRDAYVYLRAMNIESGQLALAQQISEVQVTPRLTSIEELPSPYYEAVVDSNLIYDNGGSRVLFSLKSQRD